MAVAAVLVGGIIGLAGVYGIGGLSRNAGDLACRAATDLAKKLTPLIHGEVAGAQPGQRRSAHSGTSRSRTARARRESCRNGAARSFC